MKSKIASPTELDIWAKQAGLFRQDKLNYEVTDASQKFFNNAGILPCRLAIVGDSIASLAQGKQYSSSSGDFFARSDASDLIQGNGYLTIYPTGLATWQGPGDTEPGEPYVVGNNLVWLESKKPNKGVCVRVLEYLVEEADPDGTVHEIYLYRGSEIGTVGFNYDNAFVIEEIIAGWRFDIVNVLGFPGDTSYKYMSPIKNSLQSDSYGRRLHLPYTHVYLSAGSNDATFWRDFGTTEYDFSDWEIELDAFVEHCVNNKIILFLHSVHHETPEGRRPYIDQINAKYSAVAAANIGKVIYFDFTDEIDDPNHPERAAYPGYMSGPHYSTPSLNIMALAIKDYFDNDVNLPNKGKFLADLQKNFVKDPNSTKTDGILVNATGESDWHVDNSYFPDVLPPGILEAYLGIVIYPTVECSMERVSGNDFRKSVFEVIPGIEDPEETEPQTKYGFVFFRKEITYLPRNFQAEVNFEITDTEAAWSIGFFEPNLMIMFYDANGNWLDYGNFGCNLRPVTPGQPETFRLRTPVIRTPKEAVKAYLAVCVESGEVPYFLRLSKPALISSF